MICSRSGGDSFKWNTQNGNKNAVSTGHAHLIPHFHGCWAEKILLAFLYVLWSQNLMVTVPFHQPTPTCETAATTAFQSFVYSKTLSGLAEVSITFFCILKEDRKMSRIQRLAGYHTSESWGSYQCKYCHYIMHACCYGLWANISLPFNKVLHQKQTTMYSVLQATLLLLQCTPEVLQCTPEVLQEAGSVGSGMLSIVII